MKETLSYYQNNTQAFFDSTVNADVKPLYVRFLKHIQKDGKILDFGCGSGRDTKAFTEMGYSVEAIDGSANLCKMASKYTGIKVKCMDYTALNAREEYVAIWACASLLHISSSDMPIVLTKMRDAIIPDGIIYASFKHGSFEGVRDGRYYTDMTADRFSELLMNVGDLTLIEEWFSEDVRPDKQVGWYNVILKKTQRS